MPRPASPKSYVVTWAIDMEGDSPLDAARRVAAFMQHGFTPDDDAFEVTDRATGITTQIDLADQSQ